jgi:hypothetical protein
MTALIMMPITIYIKPNSEKKAVVAAEIMYPREGSLSGPALVANSLFQGQERYRMREKVSQIGNSGLRHPYGYVLVF